ncbi:MAG: ATP-binding cassette domain-containing protein [Burkholderiales bacterium]|nr:ATP-binding cassette domain-containing protein [Burkholderiales bacterium]MDE2394086.1 ATP-binding cassette domain-containing protein [Burkholderiales bacterium]MDE2457274.1 ATP-binding cassette domain-containing protein [Burkholderiales bacterium]
MKPVPESAPPAAAAPLLEARGLVRHYPGPGGRKVYALNGVDLGVSARETLAVVGESGCGKSTLGRLLIGLDRPTAGQVLLQGLDIAHSSAAELRASRTRMQMIFQDPATSLDPRWKVEALVREPLDNFRRGSPQERRERVAGLLQRVGLRPDHGARHPHELSGGQRQRVGIARALALAPEVIVADEPVSALDVSVRAQVVNLLCDLRDEMGLALVFISHDIGLVGHISDRVAVMYLGRVVEIGATATVLDAPSHPYTQALLDAVPRADPRERRKRLPLEGDPPNPSQLAPGCGFVGRCPRATERCRQERPELRAIDDGRAVACHLAASGIELAAGAA